MDTAGIIDQAIGESERLLKSINRATSRQVKTKEECELIKANAYAWLKGHRVHLQAFVGDVHLEALDNDFAQLLEWASRQTSRARYKSVLKQIKGNLIKLRSEAVRRIHAVEEIGDLHSTQKPDFAKLISDPNMVRILERRWEETINCIENGAPLSAMVMMGALLEALLLARINQLADKTPIFGLKSTPRDKTKKALPLKDWGLNDYIEVAHEMTWIRRPAKELGVIIRDYRNFIHPVKELSSGFQIEEVDVKMFWPIFVQISDQVVKSI